MTLLDEEFAEGVGLDFGPEVLIAEADVGATSPKSILS